MVTILPGFVQQWLPVLTADGHGCFSDWNRPGSSKCRRWSESLCEEHNYDAVDHQDCVHRKRCGNIWNHRNELSSRAALHQLGCKYQKALDRKSTRLNSSHLVISL